MKKVLTVLALTSLVLGSLAWGASVMQQPLRLGQCESKDDVRWHLERSRNGVSLTCNESMIGSRAKSAQEHGQ